MNTKQNLGYAIKTIRWRLGISQKELAQRAGLSANFLCLVENGKRGIGYDRLEQLARAMGIPLEFLSCLAADPSSWPEGQIGDLLRQLQVLAQEAVNLCAAAGKGASTATDNGPV